MTKNRPFNVGLLLLVCIISLVVPASYAVSIKDVSTNPDTIGSDDKFEITVTLEGNSCGTDIRFYIDDSFICSKALYQNIGSVTSQPLTASRYNLACGTHQLRIDLLDHNETVESVTQVLEVGVQPLINISIDPRPGDFFTINFFDNDTGEPVEGLEVMIHNSRESVRDSESKITDSNGNIRYGSKSTGTYRMNYNDMGYCGSGTFYIKKDLYIDGPYPGTPHAGEQMTVLIPAGVGVKVLDSDGNIYAIGNTSIKGEANFTINKAGEYTLLVGELSTVYWPLSQEFNVTDIENVSIILDTLNPLKERELAISLHSKTGVGEKEITLTTPDNLVSTIKTDVNGNARFTPAQTGTYIARFHHEDYEDCEIQFLVKNAFKIDVLPEQPRTDRDISIIVRDHLNNLVPGATVSIKDKTYGLTDQQGQFTCVLDQAGSYEVTVSKDEFLESKETLSVISPLAIRLEAESFEIGDTIKPSVVDPEGVGILAEIEVYGPGGSKEKITEGYVINEAGEYTVHARSDGFVPSNINFTALPHPLQVNTAVLGSILQINTSSRGIPVGGITVSIDGMGVNKEVLTDEEGKAEIPIEGEGVVTISSNTINPDPDYGSATVSRKVYREYDNSTLILAIIAISIVAIAGIAFAYFSTGARVNESSMASSKTGSFRKGSGHIASERKSHTKPAGKGKRDTRPAKKTHFKKKEGTRLGDA